MRNENYESFRYLYDKQTSKSKTSLNIKLNIIQLELLIFFLILLQVILLINQISLYVSYLILPLIFSFQKKEKYLSVVKINNVNTVLHSISFLFVLIINTFESSIIIKLINILYQTYYLIQIGFNIRKTNTTKSNYNFRFYNFINLIIIFILAISLLKHKFNLVELLQKTPLVIVFFFVITFSAVAKIYLTNYNDNKNINYQTKTDNTFNIIFYIDFKEKNNQNKHADIKRIIEFLDYTDMYLDPSFNLHTLAQELGYRKEKLSQILNREMKIGFYELIYMYRIEYAKKILISDKNIVTSISNCGFNSRSTFNKYFKKFVGLNPSIYKKKYQNQ